MASTAKTVACTRCGKELKHPQYLRGPRASLLPVGYCCVKKSVGQAPSTNLTRVIPIDEEKFTDAVKYAISAIGLLIGQFVKAGYGDVRLIDLPAATNGAATLSYATLWPQISAMKVYKREPHHERIPLIVNFERTDPSRRNVLDASFQQINNYDTKTKSAFVEVKLNGARTPREILDPALIDNTIYDLWEALRHEVTHFLDVAPESKRKIRKLYDLAEKIELFDALNPKAELPASISAEYHNVPEEVRAYMRNILDEALMVTARIKIQPDEPSSQYIMRVLRRCPTWEDISPHFNEKNTKTVLKAMAREFEDRGLIPRQAPQFDVSLAERLAAQRAAVGTQEERKPKSKPKERNKSAPVAPQVPS